ncbi:hypothetical protein BN80_076 [Yersinia phage phiR1-RT]|uniref:Uncharacterized protein n=2 Tax=Tegunavirus TaxID=1921704 RepID=A0A0B5A4A0_9CAUD|nr:hypothetical protein BN80_076 [Yersinia phage phiR1-RT]YP_009200342.1 hypothetical protein AVV33_gp081 [Yersinia phage vB_YenM_TG1]AJD81891.1 hypothetical protein YenMTG1_081 [Yersinia phage vB_YenM_TG1]CCI88650.1 hypothetical protein BN80_076 [Yersinia phage phiR1-RT]
MINKFFAQFVKITTTLIGLILFIYICLAAIPVIVVIALLSVFSSDSKTDDITIVFTGLKDEIKKQSDIIKAKKAAKNASI